MRLPNGQVEVRVEPAELGRIDVSFDFDENGLRATVLSERAGTADLLRRHAEQFLSHLKDAGFDTADLSFADRRSEPGDGGDWPSHSHASSEETVNSDEATPATRDRPSGLDLRI